MSKRISPVCSLSPEIRVDLLCPNKDPTTGVTIMAYIKDELRTINTVIGRNLIN